MRDFVRVGVAIPIVHVAACEKNADGILQLLEEGQKQKIKILVFPELCITGYTCGDLFYQQALLDGAKNALDRVVKASRDKNMLVVVGMPLQVGVQLFNCAVAICKGKILGIVPKTYLPNRNEFYEKRWFASPQNVLDKEIELCSARVPFGTDLLFTQKEPISYTVGIEICEDVWSPVSPGTFHALAGAEILLNLSASNELAAKEEFRREMVAQQSARLHAAYVYANAGWGESTTDVVFSGHSMIYENGVLLAENKKFETQPQLLFQDIDASRLQNERVHNNNFVWPFFEKPAYRKIAFQLDYEQTPLVRTIAPYPFVPAKNLLQKRCEDIIAIQKAGLMKRLEHTKAKKAVLGISGGLDSTLALLVTVAAFDALGLARENILGVTMPGFGTTDRTYQNAVSLMKSLQITWKEVSIKEACLQHFADIGHDTADKDTTYENVQARERTQILMDIANKENGLVVGTGDMSELALGWATYNGDHMSMYGVNASIPKTLVRSLVAYCQDKSENTLTKKVLLDVLDTPVSPELLPPDEDGNIAQKTEDLVGPYELHDFFLYYMLRFGFPPKKILYLAQNAFEGVYKQETLIYWLKVFYRRFFSQQFKRSCLPDGPKVGSIGLSPRGDLKMPSDANGDIWIQEMEAIAEAEPLL